MSINIPTQLIDADARFCLVKAGEKIPVGQAWQTTPYKADDAILVDWLETGGNYGVISGYGGMCCLDIDDVEQFNKLNFALPPSFSVHRNNHASRHYYFKCPSAPLDAQKKWVKNDAVVDFRLGLGFMTVGAGSIAPLSRPLGMKGQMAEYEIEDNSTVAIVPWTVIEALLIKTGMLAPDVPTRDNTPKTTTLSPVIKTNAKEGHRNSTLAAFVGSMVRSGALYKTVELACLNENERFEPPLPRDEVIRYVMNMFTSFAKKEELKQQQKAKRELEEEERENRRKEHPTPQFTPQIEHLLSTHHQNTAMAEIMDNLYGLPAPDGGEVRYDEDKKQWVVWNGKYWKDDGEGNRIMGRAYNLVFGIIEEGAKIHNKQMIEKLNDIQAVSNISQAMRALKAKVLVETDVFDADENILNLNNGTLRFDEVGIPKMVEVSFYPHKKADFITRIADVDYVEGAVCPKWRAHLRLVIPDVWTRLAFQMYIGSSMVGGNPDNAAMFAWGTGKNGKTITFSVISTILGDYAISAAAATFTEHPQDDKPRGDLARMKGARLAVIPEGKDNRKLDEGILKNLTGGSDDITARYLYGRDFSFKPTAKLCFHTNHLPKIVGRDDGIWRRIYTIPFTVKITEADRIKDYDKILYREESSGIFNWMVEGFRMYKAWGGLLYTKQITELAESYKANEDILADFLSTLAITGNELDFIKRSDLYKAYRDWCKIDDTEKAFPKQVFNRMIAERFGEPEEKKHEYCWIGIRLKKPGETVLETG